MLLGSDTSSAYVNDRRADHTIYKRGRVPVKIGDIVDLYLLKTLDIPVSVDTEKNIVRLKDQKIRFDHMNSRIGIDVFNEMIFLQGAIDVDAGSVI